MTLAHKNLHPCVKWFWILFVISVFVSQSAMDLFSTLLCGIGLWQAWTYKKNNIQAQPLLPKLNIEYLWWGWWSVVIVGFLLNSNSTVILNITDNWKINLNYGVFRILEFKWILILYAMIGTLVWLKPSSRQAIRLILGCTLVTAIFSILAFFSPYPLFRQFVYMPYVSPRMGGFFADPMTFAHLFSLPVFILAGIWLKNHRFYFRALLLTLILAIICLFFSFTRGVWLAMLPVGLFLLFKAQWKVAIASILSILLFTSSMLFFSKTTKHRLEQTVHQYQNGSEREFIWKGHFLVFKENPWFGLGYGQNSKNIRQYYDRLNFPKNIIESHAHNQYLHLLAGTGILGLLFYLAVFINFIIWSYNIYKNNLVEELDKYTALGIFAAQISFCLGSLTEANFEHAKVRFMLMIVWAWIAWLGYKYQIKAPLALSIIPSRNK